MTAAETLLRLAGASQLVLVAVSPAIPVALRWRENLCVLPVLLRRIFWTYAAYILGTHLAFGLMSFVAPDLLLGGGLATAVSGFMFAWWGVRLGLHGVGFETGDFAATGWRWWAKQALGCLFVGLTVIYGMVFWLNLRGGTP